MTDIPVDQVLKIYGKDDKMMDVRAEIRRALKRSGKTRYWLAKQAGIPVGTVYAYLGKEQDMGGRYIGRLMDVLGLKIVPRGRAKN